MPDVTLTPSASWFEEEIRAHLAEAEDEPWVPNHWTSPIALVLLVMASAGAIMIGALAIDPAHPYGTLIVPSAMPAAWTLAVAGLLACGLAGVSAWLVLRQDDDLGVLIMAAVPPFRLMPALGALWLAAFFGLQSPVIAVGVGLFLLGTVMVAMMRVSRLSRAACWLLLPLLGVSAASIALAAGVLALNTEAPLLVLPL